MKNRILLSVLCVLLIGGCAAQPQTPPASDDLPAPSALPEKTIPQSALMSESPISPTNLDDYLFLDDVLYFDRMTKVRDDSGKVIAQMGDVGSFFPNYEESESLVRDLFPQDQPIVFISTAGVEAAYTICLLEQLGYDGSQLYNAGTFSNGMGNIIAYKDYPEAKYHVPGTNVYTIASQFIWNESLTPILDE